MYKRFVKENYAPEKANLFRDFKLKRNEIVASIREIKRLKWPTFNESQKFVFKETLTEKAKWYPNISQKAETSKWNHLQAETFPTSINNDPNLSCAVSVSPQL